MPDTDLVIFDLGVTTAREADRTTSALVETLSSLGLPIPPAEVESLRGRPPRDVIQELLLRYSPAQADGETVDRLLASFNSKSKGLKRPPAVRALDGAEGVFRWLRQRGIKVALMADADRKTVTRVTATLKWNEGVVDAVVCTEDVQAGPPAPFLIFRAMERTGSTQVARVAVVSASVPDLEAGATAAVGMSVAVSSGGDAKEKLETAPHTHLIESVRKFPPLLARPSTTEAPAPDAAPAPAGETQPPAEPAKPPEAKPSDPLGPGFKMGSNFEG